MKTRPDKKEVGQRGEEKAAAHLSHLGYQILVRNYRCRAGEIDLIALDGDTVVFVEVKTRTGSGFGRPEESVGWRKRRKLVLLAGWFLAEMGWSDRPTRFDVVAVNLSLASGDCVEHIRDAFGA